MQRLFRWLLGGVFYWLPLALHAQVQRADVYGFRHYQLLFQHDTVEVLVKSRPGDEHVRKPLLLFCQGSLPQPLLKLEGGAPYDVFPFSPDKLCVAYHLAIVGKPGVPLQQNVADLASNFTCRTPTARYAVNNHLTYYVRRNRAVLRYLRRQPWASRQQLVVAGHSEGSTIAAHLARQYRRVTRLIYSGGNPSGRILSMVAQGRATETDSTRTGENTLDYWQQVVNNPGSDTTKLGDTPKATYSFSQPASPVLQRLAIPVLVTYGTKDWGAPYVDLLRVECARLGRRNLMFIPYIGAEHNYFPLLPSGQPDYAVFNWDKVAADWLHWLQSRPAVTRRKMPGKNYLLVDRLRGKG
ncbi:hypothetical protein Q5H93_06465 [Hymenobacter sp. ASUV-10]|uniref:Alpha/beta hydrolase n=1 Tax=Hymenobacter aranciens TaxID=3063996 RepID=A0ABT9B7W1_9BACT|nr:hypothetical protein [Hymenobacter sp. ASUV-10]MDO7874369.1 hypothetical protein [Hymenobacter sp. ASUV-10]